MTASCFQNTGSRCPAKETFLFRLSGMPLGFILMAALGCWLAAGIFLAEYPATEEIFRQMNERVILRWLMSASRPQWPAIAWWLVLCALTGGLLLNLACCTYLTLFKNAAAGRSRQRVLLLIMHCLFALVMTAHGAGMVCGFKVSQIKLLPGERVSLPEGYGLRLSSVSYQAPRFLLQLQGEEARKKMSRKRLSLSENQARFAVFQNDRQVSAGRAHIMHPLRHGSLRITIKRFFMDKERPGKPIGVMITTARNPVFPIFFAAYILLIGCVAVYLTACQQRRRYHPGQE